MNLKGQSNPLNDFKGFRVNEIVFEWDIRCVYSNYKRIRITASRQCN